MCRFVYYQGLPIRMAQLITEPKHSLIHQSVHARERREPLNGDGFGVSWYVDARESPGLFRSITPAWSSRNLQEISRVVESPRILAHIRAATQGTGVAEANCHPFRMGDLTFMHNGDLGGFPRYRRPLLEGLSDEAFAAVRGTTDSEHFLALLWDASLGLPLANALETALIRTIELWEASGTEDHIYLNCVVTDGRDAVACRLTTDDPEHADTLYLHQGQRYEAEEGVARLVPCPEGQSSVLLSSEPLTPADEWTPVAVGDLLVISADQRIDTRRLLES
ncbi:MAG: class II glutamine amidotransferase [Gemmatimonadales bacterium]|nr:MAG: class II glutamine amidotransferase [Gemmatimonadales bacterium]